MRSVLDAVSTDAIRDAEQRESERWEAARRIELACPKELAASMDENRLYDLTALLIAAVRKEKIAKAVAAVDGAIEHVILWERSQAKDIEGVS